jgi:hypothetical protein
MTGKACFCGARWNLPAKECSEGHPMTPTEVEVLLLRARCEHLKSEYANLLAQHDAWAAQYHEEHAENEKLRAENEWLRELVMRLNDANITCVVCKGTRWDGQMKHGASCDVGRVLLSESEDPK